MSNEEVVHESVSFEEASRCPKCGHPGEVTGSRPTAKKSTIHFVFCRNPLCRWYDTNWIVEQLSDGTVPVRGQEERRPKTFPSRKITDEKIERARKSIERSADDTKPGP